ncbi:type VII secretion protein EssB/YukC [Priestia abyssalis]|uniref:type VII secretion protein EssB/YukC n=1 Tax=Priestia abyssalis TaxID=1221450 RepID=UPI0009951877|nr:type VII secretion protein EssB/YukC [Priestia abyssalis]
MEKTTAFLEGTAEYGKRHMTYRIPSSLTKVGELSDLQLRQLKQPDPLFFDCREIDFDEQYLTLYYQIEEGFMPLSKAREQSILSKLAIAENLLNFKELMDSRYVTFMYPENIYFRSLQEVKLIYRGLRGLTNPSDGNYLYHIQCLIVYIFTKHSFHSVKQKGLYSIYKNTSEFLRHIIDAKTFEDLHTAIVHERERVKEQYIRETDHKTKAYGLRKKFVVLGGIALLAFIILVSVGPFAINHSPNEEEVKAEEQDLKLVRKALRENEQLLNLYRLYYKKSHEEIIENLENEKNLSEEEKQLLKEAYIATKRYSKAISVSSEERILNYLIKNDPAGIETLKADSPNVRFEQAYFRKDWDQVIGLRSKATMDERRQTIVVDAYLSRNQVAQAYNFAKEYLNTPLMIKSKQKAYKIVQGYSMNPIEKQKRLRLIQEEVAKLQQSQQ